MPGVGTVVPRTGTEAEPDPAPDPVPVLEVAVGSEPGEWGEGIVPMGLVAVGIKAVLLPPRPPSPIEGRVGMRPVDLGAVGMRPVLVVSIPRRDSRPDPIPPRRSPEVGVGFAEPVAEAGTLTGMVVPEAVALVLLSPPRPKRSRRSDPELVVLALLDSGLWTLEPVGVAEELVVEPPRRPPRPEPMSPKMLSLLLEVTGVEAGVADALPDWSGEATVEAVEVVLEFTPRRSPTSEPRSLRMLPLEEGVADEAGVVVAAAAAAVPEAVAEAVAEAEDAVLAVEVVD